MRLIRHARRDRVRSRSAVAVAATMIATAGFLAACSSSAGPTRPTGTSGTTGATGSGTTGNPVGLDWIVTRQALKDISQNQAALAVLEQGQIFEIVRSGHKPLPKVNAIVTADFKSYTGPKGMEAAVTSGHIPTGTRALLYDPEKWSQTPVAEQNNLAQYVAMAVALAHQHGFQLIVTPGVDLTSVIDPSAVAAHGRYQAFLTSGIIQAVAPADIVDVQAQAAEIDTSKYAGFVRAVAGKLRAINPSVIVLSGLSTNPSIPTTVTAQMLVAAMAAVAGVVKGFWMNIPAGHSSTCPGCQKPQPQVGITALTSRFG